MPLRNLDTLDTEDSLILSLESELENDDAFSNKFREQRLAEYKFEMSRVRGMDQEGHGGLIRCTNEADVFEHTTKATDTVVHFGKKEFKRCALMERHLTVREM